MTTRMLGMRRPVRTPKYFGTAPVSGSPHASDSPHARAGCNNYQVMQCGVGRYFMPTPRLLTDTEKSSVPYKTPLKNHRELGVRTLIPISHILAILLALEQAVLPALEHHQVTPPQVGQQLKPHATAKHARYVSNSDMIPRCGTFRTSGMETSGLVPDFVHCVRQHLRPC